MLFKRLFLFLLGLAISSLALAQSLPSLTPPGAAAGLYTRNLAIKKPFFIDFQTEWNRLGIAEALQDMLAEDNELTDEDVELMGEIFSLDLVGREGIFVIYPNGDVFALARPAAGHVDEFIALLDNAMENPEASHGWKLDRAAEDGDNPLVVGHNGEILLFGTEGAVDRFLSGDRGMKPPVEGDLAFWIDAQYLWPLLENSGLELPPEAVQAIKTIGGVSWALDIQEEGVSTRSRVPILPDQDPELARILLPSDHAWPLGDLPVGVGVSSFTFDLAAFGDYATGLARAFGMDDLQLDLSAFGNHLALIDAGTNNPQEALQNPLGNLLVILETRDTLTAEVTLLTWMQMLAGFSTPEGSGGFSVEALEVNGMPAKKLNIGMVGDLFLVTGSDRLYLATSKRALDLLANDSSLAGEPGFRKLAQNHLADRYSSASFTDNRKSLEQLADMLPFMMLQTVSDPEAQAATYELTQKYAQFLKFVAQRLGPGISYQQVQGNDLISFGFTEVTW